MYPTRTWRMFSKGCQGVMVSGAEPYLVGVLWDLIMARDGPDRQVGPLWVPRTLVLRVFRFRFSVHRRAKRLVRFSQLSFPGQKGGNHSGFSRMKR